MSRNYLMEKDGEGQMYVPPEKRAEYELNGWKVVELPSAAQPAPSAAEDVEAGPATPEVPQKGTRKSSR